MRVVIAAAAPGRFEELRQIVQGVGLDCTANDCVPFDGLRYRLAQQPAADLVLVVAGPDLEKALPVIEEADAHAGAPVLAAGDAVDPPMMARAVRAGARECLDQARLKDELTAALDRLHKEGSVRGRRGRTVVVSAAVPGTGVTTVSSGLAFALASTYPNQVMLGEVGLGVPELALDLDLDVRYGVKELVEKWERSDARMVRQAVVEHAAGVHVLSHPAESLNPVVMPPPVMRQLAILFRAVYDFVVLDLGHSAYGSALEAMKLAEAVLVVTRLDVPALRLSRRFLSSLEDRGVPPEKLQVAANRYGQGGQVDWRKAEEALGRKVVEWIPDDPASVNQALNEGRPLVQVAPRARITRSFEKLAGHLNGRTP